MPHPGGGVEQGQLVVAIQQVAAQALQFGRLMAQGDGALLVGLGRWTDQLVEPGGGAEAGPHARNEAVARAGEQGKTGAKGGHRRGSGAIGAGIEQQIGQGAGLAKGAALHLGAEHQTLGVQARRREPEAQALLNPGLVVDDPQHRTRHLAQDLQPAAEHRRGDFFGAVEAGVHHRIGRQADGLAAGWWRSWIGGTHWLRWSRRIR